MDECSSCVIDLTLHVIKSCRTHTPVLFECDKVKKD